MKTRSFPQAALLVMLAGSTQALAQSFPAIIEPSSLDGSNGFVLNGVNTGDVTGVSVSSAGDVNGDGIDDLIIGASDAYGLDEFSGVSYLVFGSAGVGSTGTIELSSLDGTNGFKLNGVNRDDFSGRFVSSAGDVNGDGFDDLIIGAIDAATTGYGINAGVSYVVFGAADIGNTGTFELFTLEGPNGFVINGIDAGDSSGTSASTAGDVNGDGFDDIIIGAPGANPNGPGSGESYVVFGSAGVAGTGRLDLTSLDGANGFVLNGVNGDDSSGNSVSSAGDVNGDGFDDIIIGASYTQQNGQLYVGASYVIFGGAGIGSTGTFELSGLNGANGFVLSGIDPYDRSGTSVSSAGDVNGDGIDDLIIGAHYADANEPYSGESYVVFGGAGVGNTGAIDLTALDGANGFVINGIDLGDLSGRSVSSAGDVNGDGVDDIIIGAYRADPNGIDSGESYVIFGGPGIGNTGTFELSALTGANGFVVQGSDAGDFSGRSVSSAEDINSDGVDDIVIGAGSGDPNGADSGEVYVVFGIGDPSPPNPADFSGDGCVDSADLAILLAAWSGMSADLNGDMITDSADLAILLAAWGNGCSIRAR